MVICWKFCVDFRCNPKYHILCRVKKLLQHLYIKVCMRNCKNHNIPGIFIYFDYLLIFIAFNSRNSCDGLDRQLGVQFSLEIYFENFTPGEHHFTVTPQASGSQTKILTFSFVDGFLCVIAHFVRILISKMFSYLKIHQ